MPGPEPSSGPPRSVGVPWRELVLAATVILHGLGPALLGFAGPLAAFAAVFGRGPARLAAALTAVALPVLCALEIPSSGFFIAVSLLAIGATLLALRVSPRVGYAEVSLSTLGGLIAAVAIWLVLDPGFLGQISSTLESLILDYGRKMIDQAARGGRLLPAQADLVREVFAETARLVGRLWPSWTFLVLWVGVGAALQLAARWARGHGTLSGHVAAQESFTAFRLPDAWVWVLLAGMAGFLVLPNGSVPREAALNALLVAALLYACQGLALVVYYLDRSGAGPVAKLMLLILLLLPPILAWLLVPALCLGVADVWLDLRRRTEGGRPGGA